MTRRWSKLLMCLALGLFFALVAYDNVIDDANYVFVRHVMTMDTTPAGNAQMHRAIASPLAWRAVYALIVACEAAIAGLFLAAAGAMWRARGAAVARYGAAKRWALAGATLAFLLYFLGFMAGGGEWFAMWRSSQWNGQAPAFRILIVVMAVLVYLDQPDDEVR